MQNMFPGLTPAFFVVSMLRSRLAEARRNPEAGYSAEAVIVIGALVVAAIAIATWIAGQITTKGSTITIP